MIEIMKRIYEFSLFASIGCVFGLLIGYLTTIPFRVKEYYKEKDLKQFKTR